MRALISGCGLNIATPSASPLAVSSRTCTPDGSALAAASIAISLEKTQGCPKAARLWRPGCSRTTGRLIVEKSDGLFAHRLAFAARIGGAHQLHGFAAADHLNAVQAAVEIL